MEQVINTGDPATDQQIAEQIKQGMEAGGLKASIAPAPGGGLRISAQMPAAVQAVAAVPSSGVAAAALEPGAYELGGTLAYKLKERALQGDFRELRRFVADSRQAKDWEDRHFMIDTIIGHFLPGGLEAACAGEPQAIDLRLLRGAYAVAQAWNARGSYGADQV